METIIWEGSCQCRRYLTSDRSFFDVKERLSRHVETCDRNGRIRHPDGGVHFVTGYDGELPSISILTRTITWVKRRAS